MGICPAMVLRMLTAGESHGPALTVIVDGLPSGLAVSPEIVRPFLAARQAGYGRGGRQRIEHDEVEFLGGVRGGETIGAPVAMLIRNRDYAHWRDVMDPAPREMADETGAHDVCLLARNDTKCISAPRPGHADLAGGLKHNLHDMRNICERASARETVARVAAGSLARLLLTVFDIAIHRHLMQIGDVVLADDERRTTDDAVEWQHAIDRARQSKDSLGGIFEVTAFGVPPGLGTYAQWDRRLDGQLAQAIMSIPGIKGVEFGLGFRMASLSGSQVHDPISYDDGIRTTNDGQRNTDDGRRTTPFVRTTNHAGGLEGGMSNGEPIVLRAVMKPLATIMQPLDSVDVRTKAASKAHVERADISVVHAASVIAEAMTAWTIAGAMCDKFGGDTVEEMQRNYHGYLNQLKAY